MATTAPPRTTAGNHIFVGNETSLVDLSGRVSAFDTDTPVTTEALTAIETTEVSRVDISVTQSASIPTMYFSLADTPRLAALQARDDVVVALVSPERGGVPAGFYLMPAVFSGVPYTAPARGVITETCEFQPRDTFLDGGPAAGKTRVLAIDLDDGTSETADVVWDAGDHVYAVVTSDDAVSLAFGGVRAKPIPGAGIFRLDTPAAPAANQKLIASDVGSGEVVTGWLLVGPPATTE